MSPNGITPSTPSWLAKVFAITWLAAASLWLTACEEPKEIGLTPTTPVGVYYTDTFTVRTSTVLLDSVQTDRTGRLLIGRYTDPTFGSLTARAFATVDLGTLPNINSVKLDSDVICDSVKLIVDYRLAYGDTTKPQTVTVHRLSQELDSTRRYTTASPAPQFEAQPLATLQILSGPTTTGTSIVSNLSKSLGEELLGLLKGEGSTRFNFRKAFKGLAFIPGSGNTSVVSLGASGGTGIILYYRKPDATTAQSISLIIDPVTYRASAFSQVTSNRTGTPLAALTSTQPLSLTAGGGQTYVQGVTGVTTRIELPTVAELKKQGPVAINRADLIITPTGTASGTSQPFYLTLGERDASNQLAYTMQSTTRRYHFVQTSVGAFLRGPQSWTSPQSSVIGAENRNAFTFDVSGYLQSLLMDFRPNNGLVVVPLSSPSIVTTTQSGIPVYQAQSVINNQLTATTLGPKSVRLVVFYTRQTQ